MAIHTRLRRIGKALTQMTTGARRARMQADQRKRAEIVIKTKILAPLRLGMTSLAFTAELTVVHIVSRMAAAAGRLQRDDIDLIVASLAT